ncbi:MAG: hypothetical protein NVS2B8_05580 [Vulcanimicrobiaceae bacterium]
MIRCIDVALAIPDNEARTALATLQRLGVGATALERAHVYRFDVDDDVAGDFVANVRAHETIFNPNKHVLRVRSAEPERGEVWIGDLSDDGEGASAGDVRVGGRTMKGVRRLERFVGWRVFGAPGVAASAELVDAATKTLLCNPAFQKATRS